MSIDNHIFIARQPFGNHRDTLESAFDLHRLNLGDALLDHKHEIAALAALHRHGRHDDGILGADDELGCDQRSRPQRFVFVAHDAAHGDHAGGGIHRVLDHRDLAGLGALVARDRRDHLGVPGCHGIAQVDQDPLRNGKRHIDRRHLVDDGERRGIGRSHEISDFHIGRADPARKRRPDDGVALLDLQIIQRRLIGLDGADQDFGLGLGVIDIDLRGRALGDEIVVAAEIALRALELGLVLGERPLGLLDLGVDLARVERKQQIAFVDLGAVFEVDRDDGGLDSRLQRHAGNRRHRSDRIDIDGHELALRLGQFDRHRARALRSLGTGAATRP